MARCQTAANGYMRWCIRFNQAKFDLDITLAIRLDTANTQELDYYLPPSWICRSRKSASAKRTAPTSNASP